MNQFAPLHVHTSGGSLLDGHGQVDAYMERAAQLGMPALAITDHGNTFSWMDFYDAGKEHNIKPILGEEFYQARKSRYDRDDEERAGKATSELEQRGPYHLTVLARNMDGYKNLIQLSSRAFLEGFYVKPRIDHPLLEEHANGLIVLSGCLSGEVCQALLRGDFEQALRHAAKMQEIIGREHYFIEVMNHSIPEELEVLPQLVEIAKRIGAPIIPTSDSHYVHKDESQKHDLMLCVGTNAKVGDGVRFRFRPEEFYLKSYEEMAERFPKEWLVNTLDVAAQVELDLKFDSFYFPRFPIPLGETAESLLDGLMWTGLKERYGDLLPQEVIDRANYELRVIKKMGFEHYFLVVWDLLKWAREQDICLGFGRGSAASSIVSYALRITNLDPLRFNLSFDRFLIEGRKTMPDIDMDIDDRYRSRVVEYARTKYGSDRVTNIVTFSRVGARQAIRDAARVLDYDFLTGDKIAKMVPPPILGVSKTIAQSLTSTDLKKAYAADETTKIVVDAAKGLEGLVRQTGIHAAGVVISQAPIIDFIPVMRNGDTKPIVTQWDMHRVEQCGQLKIDFLSLRNLGVIDDTLKLIEQRRGITIDLDTLPLDDKDTYRGLCAGRTQGIFQIESEGITKMAIALQPSCIEDIMALIALYRPGPLGSKMDKMYIARKHGRSPVSYEVPQLEEILKDTYGLMLYQEDVLAVARKLAGFTAGEGDDLRKCLGKKDQVKIKTFRAKFVQGCADTSGVDAAKANKIYSDIEYFGGYSFAKSHSASYSMITYCTAFLKTNYSTEYMAALLTSVKTKEKAAVYLNECRRMGITVLPPDINRSMAEFSLRDDTTILFGLASIDGLGPAIVESLLSCRSTPYTDVYDFMRRVNVETLNKATLEHLTFAGALDCLVDVEQPDRTLSREEKTNLLDLEKQELGLYVSDHPLLGVWHLIEPHITSTIGELDEGYATLGGILSKAERKITKKGEMMYILTLEDLTGSIEVMVFPKQAAKINNELIVEGEIVFLEGRLTRDGDEENSSLKMFFSKIRKLEIPAQEMFAECIVLTLREPPTSAILKRLESLIESMAGQACVYLEFPEGRHTISLQFLKKTSMTMKDDLMLIAMAGEFA